MEASITRTLGLGKEPRVTASLVPSTAIQAVCVVTQTLFVGPEVQGEKQSCGKIEWRIAGSSSPGVPTQENPMRWKSHRRSRGQPFRFLQEGDRMEQRTRGWSSADNVFRAERARDALRCIRGRESARTDSVHNAFKWAGNQMRVRPRGEIRGKTARQGNQNARVHSFMLSFQNRVVATT